MPTFQRIIPLLVYRDIQKAHDFLVEAFGFKGAVLNEGLTAGLSTPRFGPAEQPSGFTA